jgi:hypothetical protein
MSGTFKTYTKNQGEVGQNANYLIDFVYFSDKLYVVYCIVNTPGLKGE